MFRLSTSQETGNTIRRPAKDLPEIGRATRMPGTCWRVYVLTHIRALTDFEEPPATVVPVRSAPGDYNNRATGERRTSLPRFLFVLAQPSLNHFLLKSPLVTNFECWKPLIQQPIDGEFVHVEVVGNLLKRQQRFRGVRIFFLYHARPRRWSARAV